MYHRSHLCKNVSFQKFMQLNKPQAYVASTLYLLEGLVACCIGSFEAWTKAGFFCPENHPQVVFQQLFFLLDILFFSMGISEKKRLWKSTLWFSFQYIFEKMFGADTIAQST